MTDQPTTCPAATWAGLTICVTCPTPEPGTACAREPGELLRAATARTTPDNPAASNNEADNQMRDRYAAAIDEGFRTFDAEQSEDAYLIMALVDSVMALRDSEFQQVRATNRRLNLRCQQAESALATIKRAVGEWEVTERGTYVPLRTIAAIGKAIGRDITNARWLLHYQRVETAEAAIERVRQLADRWENALAPDLRYAEALHAALDGPADTTPPAEDPSVDTCRPVQVDGDTIRVHGSRPLAGLELGYAAEVVAAARRKLAAESPVVPDDDGTESALTRRIRAQQRGLILPAVEPPDDSVPPVPCEACTRARARGFTLDALAHPGCADALAGKEAR